MALVGFAGFDVEQLRWAAGHKPHVKMRACAHEAINGRTSGREYSLGVGHRESRRRQRQHLAP